MPEVPALLAYIQRERPYEKARDAFFAEHPIERSKVRYIPETVGADDTDAAPDGVTLKWPAGATTGTSTG